MIGFLFELFFLHLCVATPISDSLVVDRVCRLYFMDVCEYDNDVDLIKWDMVNFDVILGNIWLSPYYPVFDYFAKPIP